MNPIKTLDGFNNYNVCGCDSMNCGRWCRFDHANGIDRGQPSRRICCPHEWEITLNYPGRYGQ